MSSPTRRLRSAAARLRPAASGIPKFRTPVLPLALTLGLSLGGCTSVEVERDTLTTGTFTSSAWAFTLIGEDIPRPALMIARANAADIQRPNLQIQKEWVAPDLHWFDWLLDILGFRYAKVTGTWGLPNAGLEVEAPEGG